MDAHTTTRFRPCEGVLHRELDGGAVLLDVRSGAYFSLNATGSLLWQLLPGDVASLSAQAVERLVDPPPDVQARVAGFLDALASRDLVEPATDG